MSNLKIGSDVNAWCTRCKMILAHTIEAMLGTQIKRVSCNTCQGKHLFKAVAPGTKATSATRKLSVLSSSKSYGTLTENRDLATAPRYSFQARYVTGALLKHPDFGVGVVTADKGSNKIEVSFQAGSKVLIHGR